MNELAKPFPPEDISWLPGATTKTGAKVQAMAYADLRAYMDRLDEVCGDNWSVNYTPWGDRLICNLTISGVTRSSTGEMDNQSQKREIGGTVAEAQAFKRACAMFGLGRYLYNLPSAWVEYDAERKSITDKARAELDGRYRAWYTKTVARWTQVNIDNVREISQDGPTGVVTSEHTTQDGETPQNGAVAATGQSSAPAQESPPHRRMFGVGLSIFGPDWNNGVRPWLLRQYTKATTPGDVRESSTQLNDDEKDAFADYMSEHAKALQEAWQKQKARQMKAAA